MRRRYLILGLLALLLLTCAAYLPVINGSSGYIWDDAMHVTKNAALHDTQGLANIWTWGPRALFNKQTLPATQQYYPVTFTSFWLEYQTWGLNPQGYHITNLCLHIAAALLLWLLLVRLGFSPWIAFFAAALFAIHPVNVESVAWISERKNTLSLFFYLLSALCWIHWRELDASPASAKYLTASPPSSFWLFSSILSFTLALLAKSVVATLPLALLVIVWWKRGKLTRRDLLGTAPLFIIAALSAALTTYIESHYIGATGPDFALPMTSRFLIAGHAIVFYLSTLLAPFHLSFIYPHWSLNPAAWQQWLFPAAVLAAFILLFASRKKLGRGPLAAALLFVIALFPALGFINFYPMQFSYVADHFQYLAALVFFAFIAAAVAALLRAAAPSLKTTIALLAILPLLGLSYLTYQQTLSYKDEITLYRNTLQTNPNAWMAAENLANLLCTATTPPQYAQAKELYDKVLALNPHDIKAYSSLSTTLIALNDYPAAQATLETAVALAPQDAATHNNLGNALMFQRKYAAALSHYDIADALDPNNPETLFNWGNTLFLATKDADAEEKFRKVLTLPGGQNAKTYFYLGLALRDQGKPGAADAFFHATQLNPKMAEAYFELANINVIAHHDKLAYDQYTIALGINPNDLAANLMLARLLKETKDPRVHNPLELIERLQRAVALSHEQNAGYLAELADALAASGFAEEASDAMDKSLALARTSQTSPEELELLMARAQQLRLALAPPSDGPGSKFSISNGYFDKPDDPAPPESAPAPVSFQIINPP